MDFPDEQDDFLQAMDYMARFSAYEEEQRMYRRVLIALLVCICLGFISVLALTMNAEKRTPKTDSVVAKTAREEEGYSIVIKTSYDEGYYNGYHAFLEQFEIEVPKTKTIKYLSYAKDKEDMQRGYVDGYHKAAESIHCPVSP